MEIKLKDFTVKIKDSLTWGDKEKIKSVMWSGAKLGGNNKENIRFDFDASKMLEAKYVSLECFVLEITGKDGKKSEFSRDWMDSLTPEDGNKVMDAVDSISKKNIDWANIA